MRASRLGPGRKKPAFLSRRHHRAQAPASKCPGLALQRLGDRQNLGSGPSRLTPQECGISRHPQERAHSQSLMGTRRNVPAAMPDASHDDVRQ
jgi:hypothetical protein